MPSDRLTELGIRKAKTGSKQKKLTDGRSLFLLLHPNGSKYWRMKYQFSGKEKTLSFGVWPEVSLTDARELRNEAKLVLKSGKDPSQVKKSQKLIKQVQSINTFGSITEEWLGMKNKEWKDAHFHDVKRALEIHVLPDLGYRPIVEIDSAELLTVLKKIEEQGKYEAAHRARQKLEAIFRYAILSKRCDQNPASNLKGTLVSPKRNKQKALGESDLPEFFNSVKRYDGSIITKLGIKMVLLTLSRTIEIRHATWEEFELNSDDPVWKIPGERMKIKRDHLVPLSKQALSTMAEVRRFTQGEHYVFHQLNNPNKPMSENTMLYAMYRMGYHGRATVHGFRATASTILNERGFRENVVEKLLSHQDGNKVRAAYNRAEYLDERREVLQWWADYLDSQDGSTDQESLLEDEGKLKMWEGGNLY